MNVFLSKLSQYFLQAPSVQFWEVFLHIIFVEKIKDIIKATSRISNETSFRVIFANGSETNFVLMPNKEPY
jgi:CRISPR/Cas system endoribonuclease Cas6 (RAMP superfamily)